MIWLVALLACSAPAETPVASTPTPAATPAPAALTYEVWQSPADATGALPTVIAMHGLGDRPDRFIGLYKGLEGPVRVIAPAAPLPWSTNTSWFEMRVSESTDAAMAAEMRGRVGDVLALIDAVQARYGIAGKPVVTGFSQGAMLSYAVAAVAPDRIAGAVPISGMVPQALLPARGSSVPVRAVHGTADSVLAHAPTAAAVEAWRGRGGDVTLTSYDGVDHTVSAEMRARVYADIEAMLSR